MGQSEAIAVAALLSVAGLIGGGLAWLRVDLDLKPRVVAAQSAAVALAFGLCLIAAARLSGEFAILFGGLAPLAVIDWRKRLLPNEATLPLIGVGFFFGVLASLDEGVARFMGAVLGYASFWALGEFWRRARGVDALGLGDAKLFAGIGAFLGWRALPEVALIAALAGIVVGLAMRVSAEREGRDDIPFGPPLAFAALISWCFGPLL